MSDSLKQVKVDNWGIYFLQRLKHFFNRTDYCDLTLQFQDNAQLKVHRLVLNACTEYFELLERTCEMYEDCLVMPDDLQADVVVPIINFMYTGQLEFRFELLEKLYQTSLIMNMPVLTKLLDGHRNSRPILNPHYGKKYSKTDPSKILNVPVPSSSSNNINKRNYSTAFENTNTVFKAKKANTSNISESLIKSDSNQSGSSCSQFPVISEKNNKGTKEPRPTRYELPEELDEDHIFDNSFTNISYTSKPLMVHPETVKQYGSKKINLFEEGSSSRFIRSSTADLVECKKISSNDNIFDDDPNESVDESEMFQTSSSNKDVNSKDSSKLFDQILDSEVPKVTIEAKNKEVNHLDHAKIISEVLKKYPHLVKSNKNIKLKILNTPNKSKKSQSTNLVTEEKETKLKADIPDFTYETDVIDSKQAAQLIALGAENIKGPWICLICGTPGRALHFTSYYNFRKHLVEVHNEKSVPTICEYCGQKSMKRNYLLHHLLTKHGVEPPSNYHFPRCNICNYVALNEALLVKHKMTHTELKQFRCNVCASNFNSSNQLLVHIQKTGHKYSAERKTNLKCIYCLKVFLRESNLYTHLKATHKEAAKHDGIIDDSEEEHQEEEKIVSKSRTMKSDHSNIIKLEVPVAFENVYDDNNVQYEIERHSDGNIRVVSKKQRVVLPKHKILNSNYGAPQQNIIATKSQIKTKSIQRSPIKKADFLQETCTNSPSNISNDEIVLIGNKEYILRDYQLIPKKEKYIGEFIMPNTMDADPEENLQNVLPTTSMDYQNVYNQNYDSKMFVKKSNKANQPVQIVVSNEEEYKALMNSQQSVIYDDRDDNKTLGLLTSTDHTTLENRTIDLGNSQSNNMMIIQDDFSINVSDPVSAENPNIVVVYSHPVDNQKQQYQIITTQAVNPQFVQSSAIITQNYETVTTSTPVLSSHTAVQNPWHNNIQSNTITMTAASDIQTMTMAGSLPPIAHVENITTSDINDLPEVHLTTSNAVIGFKEIVNAHNSTNVHNFNQSNIISSINVQGINQPNVITIEEQNVENEQTINESYNQNDIAASLIQTDSNNAYCAAGPEHSQTTTNTTINSDSVITAMTPSTIIASIDPTNAIASLNPGTIFPSLDQSTTTSSINPITTLATLDPIINIATLVSTSTITTIDPITTIATLVPQPSTASLEDPTTNMASLVPTSTIATLDSTNIANLVPMATISTLDETTNIITLDPTTIATLGPTTTIATLGPTTAIATFGPTTTMDYQETSTLATLDTTTTVATLDAPATIATLIPKSTIDTLDPTVTIATLDPPTTTEILDPTTTTEISDPTTTTEILDPTTTTEILDPTTTTEILDPTTTTEILDPTTTTEILDPTTTTEILDPTTTTEILDPTTTTEILDPTITTEILDPTTTTEILDPTTTTEILDPVTKETLNPATTKTLDTTTTESLDPTTTETLDPTNTESRDPTTSGILEPTYVDSTQDATTAIASVEDCDSLANAHISIVSTEESSFALQNDPPTTDMLDNAEIHVSTTQSDEVSHMCTKVVNSSEIPLKTTVQIQLVPEQTNKEFPITQTNIEKMKTLNEPIEEMEVDETIENIAKDIGVNPNAINVHETPNKDLKTREEDSALKNVVIESLTSEWSEDELESTPEQIKPLDVSSEEGVELEESIENIQQEVIKQVLKEKKCLTSESKIPFEKTLIEETHPNTTENTQPSEKISSLLNEWDDNDSQEAETTTMNENEINKDTDAAKNDDIDMLNVTVLSKDESIKDDNIKSLVSDWDEEDEENKV